MLLALHLSWIAMSQFVSTQATSTTLTIAPSITPAPGCNGCFLEQAVDVAIFAQTSSTVPASITGRAVGALSFDESTRFLGGQISPIYASSIGKETFVVFSDIIWTSPTAYVVFQSYTFLNRFSAGSVCTSRALALFGYDTPLSAAYDLKSTNTQALIATISANYLAQLMTGWPRIIECPSATPNDTGTFALLTSMSQPSSSLASATASNRVSVDPANGAASDGGLPLSARIGIGVSIGVLGLLILCFSAFMLKRKRTVASSKLKHSPAYGADSQPSAAESGGKPLSEIDSQALPAEKESRSVPNANAVELPASLSLARGSLPS